MHCALIEAFQLAVSTLNKKLNNRTLTLVIQMFKLTEINIWWVNNCITRIFLITIWTKSKIFASQLKLKLIFCLPRADSNSGRKFTTERGRLKKSRFQEEPNLGTRPFFKSTPTSETIGDWTFPFVLYLTRAFMIYHVHSHAERFITKMEVPVSATYN